VGDRSFDAHTEAIFNPVVHEKITSSWGEQRVSVAYDVVATDKTIMVNRVLVKAFFRYFEMFISWL
jgi:hypothetical protein